MLDLNVLPKLMVSLPGFTLYAICSILLVLKMYGLGAYTGVVRSKSQATVNKEDAGFGGAQLAEVEHPEVQRVLRAHRNDLENTPAFLALGLLAVLAGAPLTGMRIAFIAFTASRMAHSVFYLRAMQPWRTMSFLIGALAITALMVMIALRVLS